MSESSAEIGIKPPIIAPSVSKEPLNPNFWMARLAVIDKTIQSAEISIELGGESEKSGENKKARQFIQVVKDVEKFMGMKNFEGLRKKDPDYQKLIERAVLLAKPDYSTKAGEIEESLRDAAYNVLEPKAAKKKLKEMNKKKKEILSQHNSFGDRLAYSLYYFRTDSAMIFGNIDFNRSNLINLSIKYPDGIAQLTKEIQELDKQKGKYKQRLLPLPDWMVGHSDLEQPSRETWLVTMSRLEALLDRSLYEVTPVSPTPPFQTEARLWQS